jgi:carbon-monoxide dehydrogenase medium subunit
MYPASFGYFAPKSLQEAIGLLSRHGGDAKLLAGGHSLLPVMKLRLAEPRYLVDIGGLEELRGVRLEANSLAVGAMTVHADVAASDLVRQHLPGLAEAAAGIGDVQVRNRGTIGGSVAHADPGADFPVILTALNASFILVGPGGTRTVLSEQFFTGFFMTDLAPDEVLTEIRIPLPAAGTGTAYAKLPHPASGYVVVSAGALVTRGPTGDCTAARLAVGGVGGGPHRAVRTEIALVGRPLTADAIAAAAAQAAEDTEPDSDIYAGADYKRHVATAYAQRALESAARRAAGEAS